MLDEYLGKLDAIVDPEHVASSEKLMLSAVSYEPVERLPLTVMCPVPGWPAIPYRETFGDMEKMLISELGAVWNGAHVKDDRAHMIRANYGVGGMASMFGCETRITVDDLMPWASHIDDAKLDRVLESGKVDIESGLGARVFETERFYLKTLSRFENLAKHVHVYMSDTQGPFDTAYLVMGNRIYTELYDNPARVHQLLELVTDACIRFTRAQREIVGEDGIVGYHSLMTLRGAVRICDDSGINLSADQYREFSKPYNERILAELGGGWIHYCGGGHQILPEVLSTKGVTGIHFGQPDLQDIESVCRGASSRRIAVLNCIARSRVPEGTKTGITVFESAPDLESARRVVDAG